MSRLSELIRTAKQLDPQLGADLEAEIEPLQQRLPFGLNFERHAPEAVELPGRPIRVGSKVRVLPARGLIARGDRRLWIVDELVRDEHGTSVAKLSLYRSQVLEEAIVPVTELLLVAEFRDPIYPGLASTGRIERGDEKPFHAVINGENHHVLESLKFTHRGRVDAIYIDPPYNTGARDWKYNNDYVEGDDLYRHSKWLAFMERRLAIARDLLNPVSSVLIVTIDEKEYLRLGLLLEQMFPASRIQMVSAAISAGSSRGGGFSRSDEYLFFVMIGDASPLPEVSDPVWFPATKRDGRGKIRWQELYRRGADGVRSKSPGCFYPIWVHEASAVISEVGEALPPGSNPDDIPNRMGLVACWPIKADGSQLRWQMTPPKLRDAIKKGYVRVGGRTQSGFSISYIARGEQKKVETAVYEVTGHRDDGSIITSGAEETFGVPPTQWRIPSHDAGAYGTALIASLLPGRPFPYPKSLYAVEDALRFFIGKNPDALVLDFFAGSGTTAHAVFRLNKQDNGRRQSISVTNNEVSAEEESKLLADGFRAGDEEWESLGICEYITKPRLTAAITGRTSAGEVIKGSYGFTDEFEMGDGFRENVEFFTLTYESVWKVRQNRAFSNVAPLLWLRAGAVGRRIDELPNGWDVSETYGVIYDLDKSAELLQAMESAAGKVEIVFIITDDDRRFQMVCDAVGNVETIRLYSSYFQDFQINRGDVS